MKSNHAPIEIKLSRVFNLLNPKEYLQMLILLGLIILVEILRMLKGTGSVGECVFIIIFVVFAALPAFLSSFPKKISFTPTQIDFYTYKRRKFRKSIILVRGYIPMKVTYSIFRITEIEYLQTPIEKFFNRGHIAVTGKIWIDSPEGEDAVRVRMPYRIYGIPDFENFRNTYSR